MNINEFKAKGKRKKEKAKGSTTQGEAPKTKGIRTFFPFSFFLLP
jgi:hypothetical protein